MGECPVKTVAEVGAVRLEAKECKAKEEAENRLAQGLVSRLWNRESTCLF